MNALVSQNLHLSLLHVERSPYSSLNGRFERPHWALSHVVRGDVQTEKADLCFLAPAGSLMVHQPGVPYSERGRVPGEHEWLVFDCAFDAHIEPLRLFPLPPVVTLRDAGEFSRLFEALLQRWRTPSPFRAIGCTALSLQLLEMALNDWRAAGSPPRPAPLLGPTDRFAELIAWMREHLSHKLDRETLARRARMHPNSLDRAFREAHDQSPLQMLREMRLQQARALLASTDWTLGAVASKCGLEDDAYLSRVFRKRFGQSPGSYRASVKSATEGYAQFNAK